MASLITHAAVLVEEAISGQPDTLPHPLTDIAEKPLIDHLLDRLEQGGITDVRLIVRGEAGDLAGHVAARRSQSVTIAQHSDTLPLRIALSGAPPRGSVFLVSTQALWLDGPSSTIRRMAQAWQPEEMDALVLGVATAKAVGGAGLGDLAMDALGRVTALTGGGLAPYFHTGLHIIDPARLGDEPDLAAVLRSALTRGRLYGMAHDGVWFHLGTAADLETTREKLAEPEVRWVIS